MSNTKAVYAGTFDPITNGHKDIVVRALNVFDEVHVAIGSAADKSLLFAPEQRRALVEGALADLGDSVVVHSLEGLLVDFVRKIGAGVIIRGLRSVSDYEYEMQMTHINRRLDEEIETVFLMTSDNCSFISSSIVKDVARNGGNVRGLVPENVAESLERAFKNSSK